MGYYDPSNIGVSDEVLASPTSWLVILVCYIITFGMRFAERTADWAFRPQDSFILSEKVWAGRAPLAPVAPRARPERQMPWATGRAACLPACVLSCLLCCLTTLPPASHRRSARTG